MTTDLHEVSSPSFELLSSRWRLRLRDIDPCMGCGAADGRGNVKDAETEFLFRGRTISVRNSLIRSWWLLALTPPHATSPFKLKIQLLFHLD